MKSHHKGFTLIELVVVIVILGILAATALPKFVDLGTDARVAHITQLEASIKSTVKLWQGKARIAGCNAINFNVPMNGVNYPLLNCAPDGGDAVGGRGWIDTMVTYDSSVFDVTAPTYDKTVFTMKTAPKPAECSITYTTATVLNGDPTIQTVKTGC